VRRDPDGVTRRYGHLGTGNYNPVTARFYTDLSLLTADPEITASMHAVFNYLTAHSESSDYSPLLMAPLTLAESFIRLIHRETEHATAGRPARIIAKMNALLETGVEEALYAASQAGVQIDLIVRGICSLRPGVKGMSENIRVRSIIGRFLEHSRIFYFMNGGQEEIYCGSADWMPRNLFERCEVVFPIKDAQIGARIRKEILAALLADDAKSRELTASGVYRRISPPEGQPGFNAQEFFMELAEAKASLEDIPAETAEMAAEPPRQGSPVNSASPARTATPAKKSHKKSAKKVAVG
jgi:polyphosphate kinase